MNDPIKDFIEQNRAEFDHLEAPAFDMSKFKAKAPIAALRKSRVLTLPTAAKWLAAASLFIAVATFFFFNQEQEQKAIRDLDPQNAKISTVDLPAAEQVKKNANAFVHTKRPHILSSAKRRSNRPAPAVITHSESLFEKLADSSSASRRLAAILEIKKQGKLSNYVIDRLAASLNKDNNSNVRLAALDLLKGYSSDKYVSSVLVTSLATQTDPMVQLELVTLLGNMEHLKIEEKLYALAADPNTFGAVKDEAYSILLNQNRL
jgi:hypothetical protein